MTRDDEDVERVRRALLNDLENVIPFLLVGLLYVLTKPGKYSSAWLFSIAGTARILHTIVYTIVVIPQPARAICFLTCFGIQIYMIFKVLFYFI